MAAKKTLSKTSTRLASKKTSSVSKTSTKKRASSTKNKKSVKLPAKLTKTPVKKTAAVAKRIKGIKKSTPKTLTSTTTKNTIKTKLVSPKPVVTKIAPIKKVVALPQKKEINVKTIPQVRTRKSSKKIVITLPPPPKIDVSTYPKNKIKNILVSQPKPQETDKNPYLDLGKKHSLNVNFRQFIKVEGLSSQDFRLQRIEILAHGAVILTSKLSVIHYFRMCDEMRVTVPDSMKFFCINEQTAYYLQKYIQYRKRKIFFGHGTMLDLVDVIRKNKDEKFLLPVSDVHKEQIVEFLDELKINYTKGVFYKTVSADLSDIKNLNEFDLLVFFTPAGIKSLKQNFPNFKQGATRIAAFGHTAALRLKEYGFRLDIFAPNPQNPSMTGAIDTYLKESNKR